MTRLPAHSFDPTILRAYDVRGVVGRTLSPADAAALGAAFATLAKDKGLTRLAVGYDGRHSSPELEEALVRGVVGTGVDALRVGLGPSPMLYYATHSETVDGGIMITGSHNPPDYNGFKLVLAGRSFFGDDIQRLGEVAAAGSFAEGEGAQESRSVLADYVERLLADFKPGRELCVAWDAGNGAAGEAMAKVTAGLPGRHILLNEAIDGDFPAHHPDPTVEANLAQLKETVLTEGCDLGIAFDGDGDRIGVIDSQARVIWGDQLMLLFAREILQRHPGAPIIADVKASQVLFDGIAEAGGQPVMWMTGHSLIKTKMADLGAPFAGEMSAHIFFSDGYYGYDDALYAAIRLLSLLGNAPQTLDQFRDSLPALVNTPEIRFPCDEARKAPVVEEVRARLAAEGAEVVGIDGVRVNTKDGWWLLRASNTQDVLVARCEARDAAGLARLRETLVTHLAASGLEAPDF